MRNEHPGFETPQRQRKNGDGSRPHHRRDQEEQSIDLEALAEAAGPIVHNLLENQKEMQQASLEFADKRLGVEAGYRHRLLWVIAGFGAGLLSLSAYLFVVGRDGTAFTLLDGIVKVLGGVGIGSAFLRPRGEPRPGEPR